MTHRSRLPLLTVLVRAAFFASPAALILWAQKTQQDQPPPPSPPPTPVAEGQALTPAVAVHAADYPSLQAALDALPAAASTCGTRGVAP